MIDLLVNLLTPVFVNMGASAADVSNYLHGLSTYIYIGLGALLLMIIILIATHWIAKKGNRHVIRWTAVLAFLAALVIIVNAVCYGPMHSIVSGFLNASKAEISEEVAADSFAAIQKIGEEGMVLVKNTGLLPLKEDVKSLNVFGWASAHPVFSGTGSAASGDAAVTTVDIIGSLKAAGYETNEQLTNMYLEYGKDVWSGNRPTINMTTQDWSLPEPTMSYYTDAVMSSAKSFSDTAVIVIARSGGENADLPADMNAVIHGAYDVTLTGQVLDSVAHNYNFTRATFYNNTYGQADGYDEFLPGEHYLQLSQTERKLVDLVTSSFANVIVVVNANNPMELGWVNDYENIGAVILAPGTGATGMTALGEIINGSVNPSGKTADTYLYDFKAAPTWNHSGNSGNHLYTNVNDISKTTARKDNTYNGVISFVDYVEGIYMGYKFYETAAEEGLIEYEKTVQYPFGYGLSYTSFTQEITDLTKDDTSVTVKVKVTNTGSVNGKDVVELYSTPPYTNGGIEKASVNLVDFEKTHILAPNDSQEITFTVPLESLASYDSGKVKTANGGYVLEAGEYTLSVRSDAHTVLSAKTFTVDADVDYSAGRSTDKDAAVNRFDDIASDHAVLSRADHFANYQDAVAAPADSEYEMSKDEQKIVKKITVAGYKAKDHDNDSDVMPTQGASGSLKLSDLAGKAYDDPQWEELLNQLSVADMVKLINNGGWKTEAIDSVGKVATSDCDGPSGLSNYVTGSTGTQFPTEVLMAQTWSKSIADMTGDMMGKEFANASNFGWYGPAMNLHRSAFSGRNFEYFSEDAVLSGAFASYEVNAAAQHGVYAYIKHFAANDQETNRTAYLTTWMSEQTLRENVLKPFEMVVKGFNVENRSMAFMSSYNWLGLTPVISSKALLTDVLRGEWGFEGMVISDYNGSYGYEITDAAVRAGNDLMLGYGMADTNKLEDTDAATLVIAMRNACKNILYTISRSGYYIAPPAEGEEAAAAPAVVVEETPAINNMDSLFSKVNWGAGCGLAALEAIVLIRWLLKNKKTAKKTAA